MRLKTSLAAAGLTAALILTGCAAGGGSNNSNGGEGSGAALTIAKPDGAITTESHNPYLGDSSASKYGYAKVIFEPLALVNPTGDLGTTPWLAESVEWNDDYTQLTVIPRSGVTWSDGTDFTADDIVFTFEQYLSGTLTDSAGLNLTDVTADGDAVTLSFGNSKFTAQARVLHTPIVPKHIWEGIDDPNTDPLTGEGMAVGTGPYVLDNWSTESVSLTANPDYWGGDLAVPQLNYISYGDNAALTTALVSGEADWAQAFIPQIESSYLSADEDNQFLVSPTAGAGTLFMNLQTKPFNDPALREALAWTIDRQAYVDIAREGASEPIWNVTGLGSVLESEIIDEYQGVDYSVDVDKARGVLEDAGYTWENDALIDPDGEAVSFSISVPAGWSDWNTEQALLAEELDEALGIEVKVDQPDWGGWDAARQEGTFQAIIHWLEDTGNAYGLYTSTMDPKWIVDGKAAFNFGRFDDPKVTEALNTYANAASDEDRQAASAVLQTAFAEEVPAIPLGAHPLLGEFNTRNYVGWPSEDDQYASGDPTQPGIVQILTALEPAE
ncbi:ABC transporter substrate-binding protein [Microbacterium sp. EYE_5]|uniref:ABC transporter substrate-binding protein n=1 Tax=unclassified Microbacterium TaxID=2609290 RepID=UPI0020049133|nr:MULTISPECIES: ABC transporter substrate-binding protein [unclassified Microbacterium]MCK6080379.1 ABC transporter substrate-binding protein [Microbacterium sp. EYE_382]MCK6085650.1 ABC transporter substrate-binding protein [Microbacterium sp. EYE_384]MCK6122125.1 ABC transporter substrate-binding protein [Microbacterium sp. EYE_80]MCK6126413.1 ABC transporter substrate-binding protein [Microbacterium sp. EYE_79]MCK6141334.1 ABC transporter substrate-binding protein [Microbacterium sp. EYE_3